MVVGISGTLILGKSKPNCLSKQQSGSSWMTLFKQTLNLIKTMSSPTFEVIDVTPSMAKDLLRKNTSNRPLKRSRIISKYKELIDSEIILKYTIFHTIHSENI